MAKVKAVGRQHGDLMVGEVYDLVGVAEERAGIAGDVMLMITDADDQRAAVAGGNDQVRPFAEQDRQAVRPLELAQRRFDGPDVRLRVVRRATELDLLFEMMRDQ